MRSENSFLSIWSQNNEGCAKKCEKLDFEKRALECHSQLTCRRKIIQENVYKFTTRGLGLMLIEIHYMPLCQLSMKKVPSRRLPARNLIWFSILKFPPCRRRNSARLNSITVRIFDWISKTGRLNHQRATAGIRHFSPNEQIHLKSGELSGRKSDFGEWASHVHSLIAE